MSKQAYFSRDLFRFLEELEANNRRDWFEANKERYEKQVRDPFLRLIADLAPRLKKVNPHFVADPRPTGGSMLRIYRDIRFSKDKSPYKTAVAAHFWHSEADKDAAPAYYLHLQPGRSTIGAGVWRPEAAALKRIRLAIASDGKHWRKITSGRELGSGCSMAGESLRRPPPGFDADHPLIEDLQRKDFVMSASLADREVCGPNLVDLLAAHIRAMEPFAHFLSRAIGLP
jgi:uncharacterized protein (TIGR02453 family)